MQAQTPDRQSDTLSLPETVSREFLLHHRVCPKAITGDGTLLVLTAPNAHLDALDELAVVYQRRVTGHEAPLHEVEQLIERLATAAERELHVTAVGQGQDDTMADTRDLASQPPVVRYVNLLIREAYDAGASDIHLEATRTGISARFRLDGVLASAPEPPANLHLAVVSRVKLLAELDIAERRRPQDGRIRVLLESRELDLRVSTVPTMFGESVVLRMLDRGGRPVSLEELGLAPSMLSLMERLAARPHGMLLVTGPTGSGKTTTLYACLQRRSVEHEKIVTVEDPVEYQLQGVTQVPVHRQAGVTFASALRSILRQDPDVIMIGEMRDAETAEIAIQGAMTGHLVFSTLHTNDAISALPRMYDLGVAPYLAAATLEGVLAQRLVRRVCEHCRTSYEVPADVVSLLTGGPARATRLARGAGCSACRGTGFRGRIGIFELLIVTDDVKDAIARGAGRGELRELAVASGMHTMIADGWTKARAGITTAEEVLRVTQSH